MQDPSSSGIARVNIGFREMPPDRVVFHAGKPEPKPEELPMCLSQAVDQWVAKHPHYRVRTTLNVVAGGNTVAVHVWYDGRLTPPGHF